MSRIVRSRVVTLKRLDTQLVAFPWRSAERIRYQVILELVQMVAGGLRATEGWLP